ncbi:MAG TPA: phage tail protein [Polyangiaceae bacterium]|jgi:microcystin-dependent protein
MITTNLKWKLALSTLAGAGALHLVLAACGQPGSNVASCQTGNCASSSSSGGGGLAPSGAVVAFGGSAAPDGWLVCDGSTVSRTQYASLFAAIGVSHGSGDGSTTFNLPDYEGRFLRGVDHGTGRDPDAKARTAPHPGGNEGDAVGSLEGAAFATHTHGVTDKGHTHGVTDPGHAHGVSDGGHTHGPNAGQYYAYYNGSTCAGATFDLGSGTAACFDVNSVTAPSGANISIQGALTNVSIQASPTGITIDPSGTSTETRPVNAAVVWIIKT